MSSMLPDRLPVRLEKFLWSFGDEMKKDERDGGYSRTWRNVPCVVLWNDALHMVFDEIHTQKFLADGTAVQHSSVLPQGCILSPAAVDEEEKLVIFVVMCVACVNTLAEKKQ